VHVLILLLLSLIEPPSTPVVCDYPNDEGGRIAVKWELSAQDSIIDGYAVLRAADADFTKVGFVARGASSYIDSVDDGVTYRYQIAIEKDGEIAALSAISEPVASSGQWFNTGRLNIFIGITTYSFIVLWFIWRARRGEHLFIRKIPGLEALDEAVGRATEMGKPILYVPGLSTIDDIATIASLNILSQVAKKTAEYNTTLLVPNRNPVVYTVAQEVVKEAYTDAGRPDAYKPDNVYFITAQQFAYVAAVCGTMVR